MVRGALQLGLLAAALNDLRRRPASQIRGPKPLWVAISFANYLGVGPIAYFLLGRRRRWPCTDFLRHDVSLKGERRWPRVLPAW